MTRRFEITMASGAADVTEFLGRLTRERLARLIVDECRLIAEADRTRSPKRRGRTGFIKLAARKLGVTPLTVEVWMRGDCQASNEVARRLVDVAMGLNKKEAQRIVREGLLEHQLRFRQWMAQF